MGSPEPEKKTNSEDIAGLKNANAICAFVKVIFNFKGDVL